MLQPRNFKYRKLQKGGNRFYRLEESKVLNLFWGDFGMKVLSSGLISANQILAVQKVMLFKMKFSGKLWLRSFPDRIITSKPLESRMGKGKGNLDFWATRLKAGRVLFEIGGVSENVAREVCRVGSAKLGLPTRFIKQK